MKVILFIFVLLSATSCNSFLDEKIFTDVTTDDFYNNEDELEAALVAAYSSFQSVNYYDNSIFQVADLSTDMLDTRYGNNVYNKFNSSKDHNQYKVFWESCWFANNAVNSVITYAPKAVMSDDIRNEILAQAHFLRALNYFNLVRVYGPVPLVLKAVSTVNDDLYPKTASLDTVYTQIIADLQFAKQFLPKNNETGKIGRATKGAAMSLLGKVYLTYAGHRKSDDGSTLIKGDAKYYNLAFSQLDSVVKGHTGTYALFDDYADIFSKDTESGIEDIFSIQYKQGVVGAGASGGEGSLKQTHWAPQYGITHSAYATYRVVPAFYKKFASIDKRKSVIFLDRFIDQDGVLRAYPKTLSHPYVKKYIRDIREGGIGGFTNTSARDGEENTIILRYADVLLMHSEALYGMTKSITTEAIWGINEVRKRAGLGGLNLGNIHTEDQFIARLLDEREKELCFEGHGWFDYVRTGQLYKRIKIPTGSDPIKFYYWPIPSIEINKNENLVQSPGW